MKVALLCLLLQLVLLFSLIGKSLCTVSLTILPEKYSQARCMDGTRSGYYYEPSSDLSNSKKWVFYLFGGGECDNQYSCEYQLNTSLGSSDYFAANYSDTSSWYLASGYCPNNPGLCTWNHVGVPYCSQDLHSGQITEPSDATWGLYFSGHIILESILDALDELYNLKEASEIVFTGASAGGIGVWMNVDYVAKRYPNARVTAATVAGFYFYATYYSGENHTEPGGMADFRESGIQAAYKLYDAFVDETCKTAFEAANKDPAACMLSNNSFPYIESDSFAIQAQTDQTVLCGHDCFPEDYMFESPEQAFMMEFSKNMSVALAPLLDSKPITRKRHPKSGAFSAACYIHGDFSHSKPLINGMNYNQAFNYFYFNYTTVDSSFYKVADDCGIMCNPTCPINY
jgi:hypothetical protein